ncbi:uncharacterized protein DNG_05437 [Cephalotrichum gorgonifer]|uniref:Uncharacterized protein n=1 Tax=Cephalotrichum gorgonifer TaxID=2041049 RepID=A0AAE8SW93_9PEZI|nr:uncharacterized protein DNG_05437 [Cephalotrichum gorgonifer]
MPPQLLPASAAAFAPRASSVNVVLGSRVEPWLTQTLKRVNRVKRPLNSVPQHQRCLTELLSSPDAIWTLASIMLPKAPESELRKDSNPLVEALFNYQLLHIEAYIVHVDMVLRNEVAFKLTADSIEALVEFHKDIFCTDAKANTFDWPEKEKQCKILHEEFVQAINKFVFRVHVSALEGLEDGGTGELLCGKSEEVKNAIDAMMKPLPPPPPKIVEPMRHAPPLLPNSPVSAPMWGQPAPATSLPAVDAWRVLPSSPGVVSTSMDSSNTIWASMSMVDMTQTPAYSPPFTSAGMFYSTPQVTAGMTAALPLPSMLAPVQCGVGMGMGIGMGYGNVGWDRYQEYTSIM